MPKTMFEKIWDAHVVIEDLGMAAHYVQGKHVAPSIQAMMVPGLTQVRRIAEEEGIADIFREAGFDWRESGWSMRIAMNGDQLSEGERCASTSNRNFEHRQGAVDVHTLSALLWLPPRLLGGISWMYRKK